MPRSEPADTTIRSPLATLGGLCAGEPTAVGTETSGGGHDSELLVQLEVEQLSLNATSGSRQDSPILHIPFEIAAEIFVLHTEGIYNAVDYDAQSESARSAPYRLAAVCRTWREIALTTPRLWTTINIYISSIERLPLLVELTEHWITRSGQLPLNISLSISSPTLNSMHAYRFKEGMLLLSHQIRRFAPRWRRLMLVGVPADFYGDFIGFLSNVPLLDDLRLNPFEAQKWFCPAKIHLVEAPRLKHLEISGLYVNKLNIPWQNLISMEVNSVYVDEILELFKSADQLVFVKFSDICGNGGVFPLPKTVLTHHSLKSLDLRPEGGGDVNIFLENILFPSLERFICHPTDSFPVNGLLALFRNSESLITHLEIVVHDSDIDSVVTEGELVRLLEAIPTITALSVSLLSEHLKTIITDYFFHRLAGPSILPHLEVLRFMGWRGFHWSCIADLLLANAHGLKIRLIDIKVDLPHSEDDKLALYIDKSTLSRFDRLAPQNPKTTLNIVVADTGMDMIAASRAAHRPIC